MNNPISTYRFQFNKDFSFEDFEKLIPYLKQLGVGTVYASPVFESVPGSTHGYDGVNANSINPEIGSLEQLTEIGGQLKANQIQWLQDIVPNHMAFDSRNEWLMDVLEKGPQSDYAGFFDIQSSERLMVPFLATNLEAVITSKQLTVAFETGRFVFKCNENSYPLQLSSYSLILQSSEKIPSAINDWVQQLNKLTEEKFPKEKWNELKLQFTELTRDQSVKNFVEACVQLINNNEDLIRRIEAQQFYRLCYWQETDKNINYRRFFTVNGLICLNMQDQSVFDRYHELVEQLVKEKIFDGLRIDHIDGLYNPGEYLARLRESFPDQYIVVEKILEPGETLSSKWPVQGNTGYDFLALVNNLLTNRKSAKQLAKFYKQLVSGHPGVNEQIHAKKAMILSNHMGGELENLFRLFIDLDLVDKRTFASVRKEDLKEAIGEFLVQCPVYRYYGSSFPLEDEEANAIRNIIHRVRRSNRELRRAIDVIEYALLKKPYERDGEVNRKIAHFYQRCMQFTGPLMAKGVEDTLMYSYDSFIGHNEVGDATAAAGMRVDEFHEAMISRQKNWPLSLNATSTHDTKRGEDVRARLNVITDLADEWIQSVQRWRGMSAEWKKEIGPDSNDEYFIYQTLAGTWTNDENYQQRIAEYLRKALREAKTNSSWTNPNESYEAASIDFASSVLDKSKPLYNEFDKFHERIADHAIVNSLIQVLLKFTCPGVPDVYQGCELWDLNLVDPDNRRPVDYELRKNYLDELESQVDIQELWDQRSSGKIKLWLTRMLFKLRRQHPDLFSSGEYIPLSVEGSYKDRVIAFARKHGPDIYIIVAPLHTAVSCREQNVGVLEIDWKDTSISLPPSVASEWRNIVNNSKENFKSSVRVQGLFTKMPFAILKGQQLNNERGAGILLHVSSLASPFGIGDMGPEAKAFADFLHRSRQKYWQLLPLNPTEGGQGNSPYSSISSRAGNTLLISPELLVRDGLIDASELQQWILPQHGKTNYQVALEIKQAIFESAWKKFKAEGLKELQGSFEEFKTKEKEWLDDFAMYVVLKEQNGGKPWYEWKEELKFRDDATLRALVMENQVAVEKTKWLQFIFAKQWHELKDYCNSLGIQLIGDLPFYVSYDSADVWSHRDLFCLDEKGNSMGMAGVPPDAFSDDGQLWGMPVFNWQTLKEKNYDWWIGRLRKNKELFDMIRLDHFRAFSAYWEVPAGEKTARTGTWRPGPGADFFQALNEQLGALPFVAEDLGEIDEPVYQLRDEFHLPGMKVLQFAFGNDMPSSIHIPHNYNTNFVVYTGTHDNNTIRGWYTTESNEENKLALERYIGRPVSAPEIPIIFARMAYASVARLVILPLQDVLGFDERARMNNPSSQENNWTWRLLPGQITGVAEENLRNWTRMYNRE